MIGVLLLVSSITVVYALESRSDPDPTVDQSMAVDQTESAAQGHFRQAVISATDKAARQPVTQTSDTSIGNAIDDADGSVFENYVKVLIYVEAQKTLPEAGVRHRGVETSASLEPVDWNDEASVEDALERVQIDHAGDGGSMDAGLLEATMEDVTITLKRDGEVLDTYERDLTVTIGTPLFTFHEKTEEYDDQLDKSFPQGGLGDQLAYRLYGLAWGKAYSDRLTSDTERNFGNVTPNAHTEVMANHAIFAVQKDVFGETDPYRDRVMRVPMLCMGDDILQGVSDGYEEKRAEIDRKLQSNVSMSITELCNEGVVSPDGELPKELLSMESFMEMLVGDKLKRSIKVQVQPIADLAFVETAMDDPSSSAADRSPFYDLITSSPLDSERYFETLRSDDQYNESYLAARYPDGFGGEDNTTVKEDAGDGGDNTDFASDVVGSMWSTDYDPRSTGDIIDDVYTVPLSADVDDLPDADGTSKGSFQDTANPDPENFTDKDEEYSFSGVSASVSTSTLEDGDSLSSIGTERVATAEVTYTATITETETWYNSSNSSYGEETFQQSKDVKLGKDVDISAHFDDGLTVDTGDGVENAFSGSSISGSSGDSWNGIHGDALDEVIGDQLESELRSAELYNMSQFDDEFTGSTSSGIDESPSDVSFDHPSTLDLWLKQDLLEIHAEVLTETDPVTTPIWRMLQGSNSPLRDFEGDVDPTANHDKIYGGDRTGYDSAADIARVETRKAYFENAHRRVEFMAQKQEDGMTAMDRALGAALEDFDNVFETVEETVKNMEQGRDTTPGSVDGGRLMSDVEYQISGSPTYLPLEEVNRSTVPAVRPEGDSPTDIADTEHGALSARYSNAIGYPGFPLLPWPSLFFLQLDVWHVDTEGEYARFEVRTTSTADTSSTEGTVYVREHTDVSVETEDGTVGVGTVEPVDIDTAVTIPVIVPSPQLYASGAPGVGEFHTFDRHNDPEECSDAWRQVGPEFQDSYEADCNNVFHDFVDNMAEELSSGS